MVFKDKIRRVFFFLFFALLTFQVQASFPKIVAEGKTRCSTHCWTSINRVTTNSPLSSESYNWIRTFQGNSGTASLYSIWCADQLIKNSYRNGWRLYESALNTFSGDQLAAQLCPIIHDVGLSIWTNNGTTPLETSSETAGITSNGTGYLATGVKPSEVSADGLGFYGLNFSSYSAAAFHAAIGVRVAATSQRCSAGTGNGAFGGFYGGASYLASDSSARTGYVEIDRSSTTRLDCYYQGTSTGNNTNTTTLNAPTIEYYIFGLNIDGVASNILSTGDFSINFADFGKTMSSSLHAIKAADIAIFQTRMGR